MAMIAKVGITLGLLMVGVVIVVATRPADFRITRSTSIAAPPAGPGAVYTWSGNNQVGAGRTAEFTFKPADGHTVVTWSMSGEKNFVAKAMGLVVSMDTMIGGEFENGLARMKSIVELGPPRHAAAGGGQ
jgi:hypothetical protein